MPEQTYRKKLIEVDLPLDEINAASKREKSIRHGHPSTLHLWWARRPLAACRAVIFASMVDDPSSCPEEFPTEDAQQVERQRLHDLIKRLVVWENSNEESLINEARYEIARSVARSRGQTAPTDPADLLDYLRDEALPIYDPFAGGGSIPLEAQRLGLKAIASDLNPVAVLINKALIELPPRFANQPPINPDADPLGITIGKGKKANRVPWRGAAGLAADIRYYGRWMRDRAFERIGHLYPKATLPDGSEATVIAWLWTRTIPCPNPECGIAMPLVRTFQISTKPDEEHWLKPGVDRESKSATFTVQDHAGDVPAGTTNRKGATCVACGSHSPLSYVRRQGQKGNMKEQMMGIVASDGQRRWFIEATNDHIHVAKSASPQWIPEGRLFERTMRPISLQSYGITHWHELFTQRQLVALTTFSDLVSEARQIVLRDGGTDAYADAISTYLSLAIGRDANMSSSFTVWHNSGHKVSGVFGRQAIPMVWDFPEKNQFSSFSGNWLSQIEWITKVLDRLPAEAIPGDVYQADAATTIHADQGPIIVTDPPYYDNILYADTSDFFYVWLRQLLRLVYPELFAGMLSPKMEEIVAHPQRFDDAEQRFEKLLRQALQLIRDRSSNQFPSSIFYAYKQQEELREGTSSTGWDTMLGALVAAGFQVVGTWPMRTELVGNLKKNLNSLASSVILVCRPRPNDAPIATRRQFLDALDAELPGALDRLTRESHIAPVDLAQAAIGPGMEVYSRYSRVETIGGDPVSVREALVAINQAIATYDEHLQGKLDLETRFCLDWLIQHEYTEGGYGEAELLSQAKNVSVEALAQTGLLRSGASRVSLVRMEDYDHSPEQSARFGMTTWEGCLRIGWQLSAEQGEGVRGAARVAKAMGSNAEFVERLARILYNHYDRRNDSRNAVIFNSVVTEWPNILREIEREGEQLALGG